MQYVLDNCITSVLPWSLIVSRQPARFASPRASRRGLCVQPLFTLSIDRLFEVLSRRFRLGRKGPSLPQPVPLFNLSADRPFAVRSGRFRPGRKKQRKCPNSAQFWCNISPLDATLLSPLLCVANKELAQYLSPLNATLTKNIGGWGAPRFMPFLASLPPYFGTSSLQRTERELPL